MLKYLALASALLCALTINAEARQRHKTYAAHPDCNITMPCEGVGPSVRGEHIAKRLGFGAAQKVYTPRVSGRAVPPRRIAYARVETGHQAETKRPQNITRNITSAAVVAHPPGCPARAFCGCGAAVRIFGAPIRSVWLAANWFKFPRTAPAPGAVAVRRHHVFVLEADLGGGVWRIFDANSGRGLTRIHARSIAGYVIVNPRAA